MMLKQLKRSTWEHTVTNETVCLFVYFSVYGLRIYTLVGLYYSSSTISTFQKWNALGVTKKKWIPKNKINKQIIYHTHLSHHHP